VSGSSGGGGHEVDLGRRKRSDTMQPEIKQTRKALDSLLNGNDPLEALVLAGKWLLSRDYSSAEIQPNSAANSSWPLIIALVLSSSHS
jgi:hypothetical protein